MGHLQRSASQRRRFLAAAILAVACGASPGAARGEVRSYALVGGSSFQRGCFEPCACPIGVESPLAGTFLLVFRSDNGLFAEYDVVDVRWKVQGSTYATPPDAAIMGTGTYTVGGEFAIEQRMQAELQIADEPPAAFDSGRVAGGGGFPDQIGGGARLEGSAAGVFNYP